MSPSLRIWIAMAALGLATLQPGTAEAQARSSRPTRAMRAAARAHFDAAEAAKARGDYPVAAREYLAAYDEVPYPDFLYNTGEVHRLAGDKQQAVEYFQKYLALDPQGRGADAARASIEALTAAIAAEQAEAQRLAGEEEAARAAAARAAATRAPPPGAPAPVDAGPVEPATHPGRRLRIAGLASSGVGVAAIGASIFFGLRARSLEDEASRADVYDPELDDRGNAAERAMFITAGAGAAALGAGVVLYLLGRRAGAEETRSVTIAPSLAPSSLAVSASVRF